VIGFRPTFGRYPGEGIMPLTFDRFDQAGPFANAMADVVLFDDVLTGAPPLVPPPLAGLRFGFSEFLWSDLDAEVERIAGGMLRALEGAGAAIVRAEIPDAAREAYNVARQIIGWENTGSIAAFLERNDGPPFDSVMASLSANLKETYRAEFREPDYHAALTQREDIMERMREYMAAHRLDALAFPPVLTPALPLGDNHEVALRGRDAPLRWVIARNTALASCTAFPSLTIPAGLTNAGLPVGVEFLGRHGDDRALLAAGLAIEAQCGRLAPPAS
jgi:mandelamide amidase